MPGSLGRVVRRRVKVPLSGVLLRGFGFAIAGAVCWKLLLALYGDENNADTLMHNSDPVHFDVLVRASGDLHDCVRSLAKRELLELAVEALFYHALQRRNRDAVHGEPRKPTPSWTTSPSVSSISKWPLGITLHAAVRSVHRRLEIELEGEAEKFQQKQEPERVQLLSVRGYLYSRSTRLRDPGSTSVPDLLTVFLGADFVRAIRHRGLKYFFQATTRTGASDENGVARASLDSTAAAFFGGGAVWHHMHFRDEEKAEEQAEEQISPQNGIEVQSSTRPATTTDAPSVGDVEAMLLRGDEGNSAAQQHDAEDEFPTPFHQVVLQHSVGVKIFDAAIPAVVAVSAQEQDHATKPDERGEEASPSGEVAAEQYLRDARRAVDRDDGIVETALTLVDHVDTGSREGSTEEGSGSAESSYEATYDGQARGKGSPFSWVDRDLQRLVKIMHPFQND